MERAKISSGIEKKFLFSKLNLKNEDQAINLSVKSRFMQKSANSILEKIKSLSRDDRVKSGDNKNTIKKGKLKIREFRNNKTIGKNKPNSVINKKLIDGNTIPMNTITNNRNFFTANRLKLPTPKTEKIIKRFGTSNEGFINSLLMSSRKDFNLHKFFEINMYQTLRGSSNGGDKCGEGGVKVENNIMDNIPSNILTNMRTVIKTENLEEELEPEDLSVNEDNSDNNTPQEEETRISTELNERKRRIFSSELFSRALETNNLFPTQMDPILNTITDTHYSNSRSRNQTFKEIKTYKNKRVREVISPYRVSISSKNTLNKFKSNPGSKTLSPTNSQILLTNYTNPHLHIRNNFFQTFDNVRNNLEEIKNTLQIDKNLNNLKFLKVNQKFQKSNKIDEEMINLLKDNKRAEIKSSHNKIFPQSIEDRVNSKSNPSTNSSKDIFSFLRTTDRYKKINSDTVYKFRNVIKESDKKLQNCIKNTKNSRNNNNNNMFNHKNENENEKSKFLSALVTNNYRLKRVELKLQSKKKSLQSLLASINKISQV